MSQPTTTSRPNQTFSNGNNGGPSSLHTTGDDRVDSRPGNGHHSTIAGSTGHGGGTNGGNGGGHGGNGGGHGGNGGGYGNNGGTGVNHYYTSAGTGPNCGGTGVIPSTYVNNYYCNNVTYISNNWSTSCNSYYGYGYYDRYTCFGGFNNYASVGFNYYGWYGDLSFTLVYPFLEVGCQFVTFVPRNHRRIVILTSACGTYHWRVVERRTWIPGQYAWVDGYYSWIPGYYSWRVVEREPIYDYWSCPDCYYY